MSKTGAVCREQKSGIAVNNNVIVMRSRPCGTALLGLLLACACGASLPPPGCPRSLQDYLNSAARSSPDVFLDGGACFSVAYSTPALAVVVGTRATWAPSRQASPVLDLCNQVQTVWLQPGVGGMQGVYCTTASRRCWPTWDCCQPESSNSCVE